MPPPRLPAELPLTWLLLTVSRAADWLMPAPEPNGTAVLPVTVAVAERQRGRSSSMPPPWPLNEPVLPPVIVTPASLTEPGPMSR